MQQTKEVRKQQASKPPETRIMTGAEAVLECLLAEDVSLIFGYPGGAIMPDGAVGLILDINGLVRSAESLEE